MSQIYRLTSSNVFAPNVVRWAVNTFHVNPDISVRLLSEGWSLPLEFTQKICREELPYTLDADVVVVEAPFALALPQEAHAGIDGSIVLD